jgi:hypothetical protein
MNKPAPGTLRSRLRRLAHCNGSRCWRALFGGGNGQLRTRVRTRPFFARQESTDQIDAAESTEPTAKKEPIDKSDPNDPMDPTESVEPTDPIESTEFFEAIERIESSDATDQSDPRPSCCFTDPSWAIRGSMSSTCG